MPGLPSESRVPAMDGHCQNLNMSQIAPKKFNTGMPDIPEGKAVDVTVSKVVSEKIRPAVDALEIKTMGSLPSNTHTTAGTIPSIVTYSSSGRGPAKITVQLDPADLQQGDIFIQPPQGWTESREKSLPMPTPRAPRLSQGSESIRSSTTTIRTSMASTADGKDSVAESHQSSDSTVVSQGGAKNDDVIRIEQGMSYYHSTSD
jgi:hypothetical protein